MFLKQNRKIFLLIYFPSPGQSLLVDFFFYDLNIVFLKKIKVSNEMRSNFYWSDSPSDVYRSNDKIKSETEIKLLQCVSLTLLEIKAYEEVYRGIMFSRSSWSPIIRKTKDLSILYEES